MAQRLAEKFAEFHGVIHEIREQLHSYRHIAEVSPLPTALISREGHNVYTNQAYQIMLECSDEELLNQGWENFCHPDDLAATLKAWFGFVHGTADHFHCDMRFITKESKRVLQTQVAAARIPNDGFVAFLLPCDGCPQLEKWLPRLGTIQQPPG